MPDLCTIPLTCTAIESLSDCILPNSTFAVEIKVTVYLMKLNREKSAVCLSSVKTWFFVCIYNVYKPLLLIIDLSLALTLTHCAAVLRL